MAILRLNDDAQLLRPSSAPELASRVTGAAVPLDDEQAVVVTLLHDGPIEVDDLLARAREHGVSWSRPTMEAFIDVLERWGLLEIDRRAPSEFVGSMDPEERTVVDVPPQLADAVDALRASARGRVASRRGDAQSTDEDLLALAEPRPTRSGEAAKTLKMPRTGEEVAPRPTEAREAAQTLDLSPSTLDLPEELVGVEAAGVEAAGEDQVQRGPRPMLRLVPSDDEQVPTNVTGSRRVSPARAAPKQPVHARLLPQWMPRLVPHSRDILLVDSSTNAERLLAIGEYQVARMLDGNHSPQEVVDRARSAGVQIQLDDVLGIIQRLVREGVVDQGATRLPPIAASRPDPASRAPAQRPKSELMGTPFADLGASADSIMESLGFALPHQKTPSPMQEVTGSPFAEHEPTEALTRAAELVQADRRDEAEKVLRSILERNPGVVQALAMLELIGGRQRPRAHWRLGWIGAGIAGLVVAAGLIPTLAIRVEPRLTLPCRIELVKIGEASSPIAGQLTTVEVREGMLVEKGQLLARVADPEHRRRMAELRLRIADTKELLRIMRTSGSADDERKQKKLVAALSARLKESRCADGQPCQRELARVREQLESAQRKLKFCEWQAEPDEIEQVAGQVTKLEQELAPLTRKPPEEAIVRPRRGLVASVKIAKGQTIERGAVGLAIADAGRFVVVARSSGQSLDGAVPSQVRLVQGGTIQTYTPSRTATWRGEALRVDVSAAASTLPQGACQLELTRRKISLLRSWFQ